MKFPGREANPASSELPTDKGQVTVDRFAGMPPETYANTMPHDQLGGIQTSVAAPDTRPQVTVRPSDMPVQETVIVNPRTPDRPGTPTEKRFPEAIS